MLYLDHAADVPPVRAEFERQVTGDPRWDKRAQGLQVTDMSNDPIEVRLMMTARNTADPFHLRRAIRAAMLAWHGVDMPVALTRGRTLPVSPAARRAGPWMAGGLQR